MSAFFADWTTADWVTLTSSIILFVAGAWVSKFLSVKQERIIKELSVLQTATAELQMREKIGCIKANIGYIRDSRHKKIERAKIVQYGEFVVQDSLSVVPLFKFAPERLQREYGETVRLAVHALQESPDHKEQIDLLYSRLDEQLDELHREGQTCAAILAGAIQQSKRSLE